MYGDFAVKRKTRFIASLASTLAAALFSQYAAATTTCDRACLTHVADGLLGSMVAHDPSALPLSTGYKATENAVPAALSMMTIWRTATGIKHKYYVIDPKSEQLFLVVTISEGAGNALLFGRLKVRDQSISEIELYTDRSRSDGGFQFDADGPGKLPDAWTIDLVPQRRASRAQLISAGRSIFDTDPALTSPPFAASCVMMENGKVVAENPDVLKEVMPPPDKSQPSLPPLHQNADGTVSIPCGSPPFRPTDRHARTDIVDEEQSVVVSLATIPGVVEPYVITKPTESAFVPDAMLKPYVDMLTKQQASGRFVLAALKPTRASVTVAQMHRIYDGKVQGMHLLEKLGPPEAMSPWVEK